MRPLGSSLVVSATLHVVAVTGVVVAITGAAAPVPSIKEPNPAAPRINITRLVFIATPGPGGGGGGGGNKQKEPIRRAEAPGRDELTLQVRQPVVITLQPVAAPVDAIAPVVLDAKPLASGTVLQSGLPVGGVPTGTSLGPGSGGGVGDGVGTGIGSGTGPGIGPGSGGGTGGGVYRPGGGVSAPRLLYQVRPTYTEDALVRKIQGSVELELVVTREGSPVQIRVRRSLDPGLDNEAIKAVKQWRFAPGQLGKAPVDVWVVVILDFTIR